MTDYEAWKKQERKEAIQGFLLFLGLVAVLFGLAWLGYILGS